MRQADAKTQLEQFAPDPLRSPQSVVPGHFLDQGHGLSGDLWCASSCSGFVLPEESKPLTMPAQKRLWLDNEQGLFPGPNRPCQKHQEHPVRFGTCRSFHLSPEDDQRLSQEGVFCNECGLASGKVCQRPQEKRGVGWFCPGDKALVERLKTKASQPFDKGENPMHSVCYPFVKMSR